MKCEKILLIISIILLLFVSWSVYQSIDYAKKKGAFEVRIEQMNGVIEQYQHAYKAELEQRELWKKEATKWKKEAQKLSNSLQKAQEKYEKLAKKFKTLPPENLVSYHRKILNSQKIFNTPSGMLMAWEVARINAERLNTLEFTLKTKLPSLFSQLKSKDNQIKALTNELQNAQRALILSNQINETQAKKLKEYQQMLKEAEKRLNRISWKTVMYSAGGAAIVWGVLTLLKSLEEK